MSEIAVGNDEHNVEVSEEDKAYLRLREEVSLMMETADDLLDKYSVKEKPASAADVIALTRLLFEREDRAADRTASHGSTVVSGSQSDR